MIDYSLINGILQALEDLYEENPLPSVEDIAYRVPERSIEEIQDFFDNFDEYITEISAYQRKIKKLHSLKSEHFYNDIRKMSKSYEWNERKLAIEMLDKYYDKTTETVGTDFGEDFTIELTEVQSDNIDSTTK